MHEPASAPGADDNTLVPFGVDEFGRERRHGSSAEKELGLTRWKLVGTPTLVLGDISWMLPIPICVDDISGSSLRTLATREGSRSATAIIGKGTEARVPSNDGCNLLRDVRTPDWPRVTEAPNLAHCKD